VALPIFSVVFGSLITVFGDTTLPEDVRRWRISAASLGFLGIGVGGLIAAYFSTLLWITTGERIGKRLREMFLNSLLRQEVDFFDQNRSGHLMSQLSIDVALVQSGISEKMGNAFQHGAQVLTGIIVGFIFGTKDQEQDTRKVRIRTLLVCRVEIDSGDDFHHSSDRHL
jgi:ATP-binding cassette, subfamily B (MDR/TAP), member 1